MGAKRENPIVDTLDTFLEGIAPRMPVRNVSHLQVTGCVVLSSCLEASRVHGIASVDNCLTRSNEPNRVLSAADVRVHV